MLIFDELLNEIFFVVVVVFLINIAVRFRLFIIHRRSQRGIFLTSSVRPSVISFIHTFCLSGTIS